MRAVEAVSPGARAGLATLAFVSDDEEEAHGELGAELVSTSYPTAPTATITAVTMAKVFRLFSIGIRLGSTQSFRSLAVPLGRVAGGDGLAVGADGRMLLRLANLLDRSVGDREVDLVRRGAGFGRTEAQIAEQGLGYAVMT
jgi:hypothetical protein